MEPMVCRVTPASQAPSPGQGASDTPGHNHDIRNGNVHRVAPGCDSGTGDHAQSPPPRAGFGAEQRFRRNT